MLKNSKFVNKCDFRDAVKSKVNLEPICMECVNEWIKKPKDILIISGAPGVGKSYMAAAIYHDWKAQGKQVVITTENDFFTEMRNLISEGHYDAEFEKYEDLPFFIYDDFGTQTEGNRENLAWRKETLFRLFLARYESRLPTIITTNLSSQDMYENFDARFYDRLCDSRNVYIELGGSSLRKNRSADI